MSNSSLTEGASRALALTGIGLLALILVGSIVLAEPFFLLVVAVSYA